MTAVHIGEDTVLRNDVNIGTANKDHSGTLAGFTSKTAIFRRAEHYLNVI